MISILILLIQQVTTPPQRLDVKTFEDVQIGMPGDYVVESLAQPEYTVESPELNKNARIVRLNGKYIGSFF